MMHYDPSGGVPSSLPSNEQAEAGFLSVGLQSPGVFREMCSRFFIVPGCFHNPAHKILFGVLSEMMEARRAVDLITFSEAVERKGSLDSVGGRSYISEIYTFPAYASHAEHYARILYEKRIARDAVRLCKHYAKEFAETGETLETLARMQRETDTLLRNPAKPTYGQLEERCKLLAEENERLRAATVEEDD